MNGLIIKAQKLNLEQLGPSPFSVLVPLKSLCTRKEEEPQEISITPAALRLPPNIPLPKPAEKVLAQTKELKGLDHYDGNSSDSSDELEYMSVPPEGASAPQDTSMLMEIDSDDEYDSAESRAEIAALLAIDASEDTQATMQLDVGSMSSTDVQNVNPGYVQQQQ